MRHGYNRRATDVIASAGPLPARAFCYHYEKGFGKAHASRDLTVAVVETEANRPGVWIGRGPGVEAGGSFERYRPVRRATEVAGTTQREPDPFEVYAESARWVQAHFGPEVRRMLQVDLPRWACEVRGPFVALYTDGVSPVRSQIELLTRAEAIAATIEDSESAMA
jgi:hypothetical protein